MVSGSLAKNVLCRVNATAPYIVMILPPAFIRRTRADRLYSALTQARGARGIAVRSAYVQRKPQYHERVGRVENSAAVHIAV